MMSWDEQYQHAEAMRKSGKYSEAEVIFRTLWQDHPVAAVGARWIYCLRKLEDWSTAIAIGTQVVDRFPENEWARRELAWAIYGGELKPAEQQSELGRVIKSAERMLSLTQDELATKKAVFAVVDAAKARSRWDIVSAWCDHLDRNQLSVEPNVIGDRKVISDREHWYFAKVKALINLEQWPEARQLALEAIDSFPRKDDFRRWAAQAMAQQGDVARGVDELEELVQRGSVQWYIPADLADMQLQLAQYDNALRNACKAALAPGEDKHKVKLFELLARIQLLLGNIESASRHSSLARGIRQREGWGVKSDLVQLQREIDDKLASAGLLEAAPDVAALYRQCRSEWKDVVTVGQVRHTGQVNRLIDGKDFGFIAPDGGGEDVYVKVRDLPRSAQAVGARVEYILEQAFDVKKNRAAVRAADVRALK